MLIRVNFVVLFIFFIGHVNAQINKGKDFLNIKAPAINYPAPNPDDVLFEEDLIDSSGTKEIMELDLEKVHNPYVDEEEMDEDSISFDDEDGELSVVEVNEQMNIDSIWITIAEYYAIWDSRTINPYKIDGADFKDTISIMLYDSTVGFRWSMPLTFSKVNSRFGHRHYRWHYGTDLGLDIGDPVMSVFDGIVRIVKYDARGYGRYVLVRHINGLETLYGHLASANVSAGQLVKAGEVIGKGGNSGRSTGPHLHFEVRYEGNAVDPENIFNFKTHSLMSDSFNLSPEHFKYLKEARKVYYHSVRSGDTLGGISRKYRVSINQICKLNGISTRTVLRVGKKLRIR